jgi:hypothetical protein
VLEVQADLTHFGHSTVDLAHHCAVGIAVVVARQAVGTDTAGAGSVGIAAEVRLALVFDTGRDLLLRCIRLWRS